MSIFPERLKTAMDDHGVTANELSIMTGISNPLLSNYLHGRYLPKHDKLTILAAALGVSVEWLLGVEKELYVPEDQIILAQYNALNEAGRQKLIAYADDLLQSGRYQKEKKP